MTDAREARVVVIESAGARLHAVVWPRPAASTVVRLHGGPGLPMDLTPIATELGDRLQVVAFDQRGTVRSPAPGARLTLDEHVADIDAVCAHVGAARVHLLAHSWGGLLAQVYAQARPARVASLGLVSPSSGTGAHWREGQAEVLAWNRRHGGLLRLVVLGLLALASELGSDRAARGLFARVIENYRRPFDPAFRTPTADVALVRARAVNRSRAAAAAAPLLAAVPSPPFPVTVVYGEHDIVGRSREHVRTRWPGARWVEIAGAGHLPWLDRPAIFAGVLREHYQ